MEPNVQVGFSEILLHLDEIDARWEQRFADVEALRERHDYESKARFADIEARSSAIEERLNTLKLFCTTQTSANVAVDNWGGLF
jgi:transcription elongation GreA/GreB family factor